ncbi:putattive exported protein [Bordetella ansorpii]|uniref:Putattive exported protein n=1 Tax=Bordetella ansorpii TaxID=288768 RepID=A0A157L9K4_9BORD|nr:tripartite tricarboxylate transporter substrate binding protein [Bordetella ansorpii]SAH93284.1 putattive exported protein [Bordetella ansorpii]
MNRRLTGLCCAALLALAGNAATAQDKWPDRAIRVIIPSTPGGGTDFIGRTLSQKIGEATQWNLVPENRPGASGTLGLAETSHARPDGYDIVIGQTANVSLAPWMMKLSFDPARDLKPIAWAVDAPTVLLVNASSPYKTWQDLVKDAAKKPGQGMTYGTSGTGSVAQVAGELLQEASGFKLLHVPYKGSAPAIADLMGGHLDMAGTSVTSALSLVQSGKVRALAVTSLKRSTALPDVPTLDELGYKGFNIVEWYGVFGPAKLPEAVADRINAEVNKALKRDDVRKAIITQGQEPRAESRAAFASMVDADIKRSKEVIAKSGIKAQ